MEPLLYALAGLAAGALVGWFAAMARAGAASARAEAAEAAARRGEQTAEAERTKRSAAEQTRAAAEAQLAEALKRVTEMHSFVEQSRKDLENAFKALSTATLESTSKTFLDLATEKLKAESKEAAGTLEVRKKEVEALVAPIKEKLVALETQTKALETKREGAYASLLENLAQLDRQTRSLGDKTTALTATLTGSTRARGRWGEVALRNLVELAGMTEHCDFEEQEATESGSRPDLVVRLPGERRIAIDAKAPLDAFFAANETKEEAVRAEALGRHGEAIRAHVKALSSRAYWDALGGGVDYVVMFLPGDSFLAAAFEVMPGIWEESIRNRVLIATPVTLLALLKTVGLYWQQKSLAENAAEIEKTARELYERAANFSGPLADVGAELQDAVKAYNRAVASFEGRLLPFSKKLEELGAAGQARKEVSAIPPIEVQVRELRAGA